MEVVKWNKCQTPLEELGLEECPQEVQEQFWDFLNNVPFIRWLVSADRPFISELPRDEQGRVIIDVTKPPILEDSDYFRQTAIYWNENKHKYTNLKPNRNPNSEFGRWIREERRRGWEGFLNPKTGMWVTGDHYWLLNYSPMHLVVKRDDGLEMRATRHPKFWDGQFFVEHYNLQARQHGHHSSFLASRGKGKTGMGANKLSKRFIIGESAENKEDVQCMVTAADRTKLMGTNQILDVFVDDIDFCAKYTQFASRRLKSSLQEMAWEMGYKKSGSDVAYGSKNSVSGIISGVNQDKLNGSRGVLYLIEEAGIFKDLLAMYNMIRPSVEQGTSVFGQIIAYGCVCAGTKVWTNDGRYLNIEDLHKEDGIIGYEDDLPVQNTIGTLLEPRKKPCVRITWEDGGYLECSTDHPILKQVIHTPRVNGGSQRKRTPEEVWARANELRKGDRIIEARYIGAFGNDTLGDPRLVGMLIGDGSYGYDNTPKFSSEDEELLTYIKNKYSWSISAEHKTKEGRHYQDIRVKGICSLLRAIGIYGQTKTAKRLPVKYQTLTEEDTRLLLAGLYDTDGCITRKGNDTSIQLVQANRTILEQVAILLRKFGILSTIAVNKPSIREDRKDKNPWYILRIGGRINIQLFYENIPLIQRRKVAKLEEWHKWSLDNPVWKSRCYNEKKILPRTIRSVEYIGIHTIYNLSAEQSHTYLANNIVTHNTAGDDMSDFTAFQEIFYSPEGYNMEALDNVFDKEGQGRKKCCMFYPAYLNYDDSCVDENGNSDVTRALKMILMDRYKVKYGSTDVNTITKRISQYPITPQEAIIRSRGSIFPVTELNERLNQLDNDPSAFDDVYVGELVEKSAGVIEFKPNGDIPIRDFPTKDNKVAGALEIFQMPQKDARGEVFPERYYLACLKEGEMINTESGLKPVEEVTLEDRLINIEGQFVNIKNLQRYYNEKPVYKVKLHSIYNSTTFSDEHPIYCATPERHYRSVGVCKRDNLPERYYTYNFDFRKVKDLKVGDVVKAPNLYRKEKPFMHYWVDTARIDWVIDNPMDKGGFWWLLGLIIGDGWASSDGTSIHICFNSKETQYIKKAKFIVENIFHRKFTFIKKNSLCVEYSFGCKTFNSFIREYIGCGAGKKHLSEWIKYIPCILKKDLILGYLASDGCVTRSQIEYVSISLKLLNDFQDILFSVGIVSSVSKMRSSCQEKILIRTVNSKDKYHLRIDRTHTQIIKSWSPDDLKLRRCSSEELFTSHNFKRIWMSDDLKYIYIKVAAIQIEEYVGNVYNFECDTHTFMCNYIPTHNCDPYDDDVSNTMSLGSILVLDIWTDKLVAEYTGRPTYAEDLYEIARKLCFFYNGKLMYENNKKGLFGYFSKRNCLYKLADTPQYLRDIQLVKEQGFGNKAKGIPMYSASGKGGLRDYAFKLAKEWLLKPVTVIEKDESGNEIETTIYNLYNIKNRALLKELILYNPSINVDRIMALVQLMLYREEKMILWKGEIKKEETRVTGMAADDYWKRNYPGKKKEIRRREIPNGGETQQQNRWAQ